MAAFAVATCMLSLIALTNAKYDKKLTPRQIQIWDGYTDASLSSARPYIRLYDFDYTLFPSDFAHMHMVSEQGKYALDLFAHEQRVKIIIKDGKSRNVQYFLSSINPDLNLDKYTIKLNTEYGSNDERTERIVSINELNELLIKKQVYLKDNRLPGTDKLILLHSEVYSHLFASAMINVFQFSATIDI